MTLDPKTQVVRFGFRKTWHKVDLVDDCRTYYQTRCRQYAFPEHWIDSGDVFVKTSDTPTCKRCLRARSKA
jgi:hypothetical protein